MEIQKFKTMPLHLKQSRVVVPASWVANGAALVLSSAHWSFEFVSDFGFQISYWLEALFRI